MSGQLNHDHHIEEALNRATISDPSAVSRDGEGEAEIDAEVEDLWSPLHAIQHPLRRQESAHSNIIVSGNARVHIGDNNSPRAALSSKNDWLAQTRFTGFYAHSSLHPVSTYVPRTDLERQLHERLPPLRDLIESSQTRAVVIWGLGGVGKSQLARNYIHKHQEQYQRIFWLEAGQKQTLERDFIQIHGLLFNNADESANRSVDHVVAAVKSWLHRQEGRTLWVMDSADTIEDAEDPFYIDLDHYLPRAPGMDVIVTTRSSRVQNISVLGAIAVGEMSEDGAVQLFRKCAKLSDTSDKTNETVREIVLELGCLALAVTLAGAYVYETHWLSSDIGQYLYEYRTQRKRVLGQNARRHEHQYSNSVLNTWEMSFAAVERQSAVAARLLHLVAFLNFDDIFLDLFTMPENKQRDPSPPIRVERSILQKMVSYIWGRKARLETTDTLMKREELSWDELLSLDGTTVTFDVIKAGFKTLEAYSLVSWRTDHAAYGMHKLVHAWGHDRLDADQQQVWAMAVMRLLGRLSDRKEQDLPSRTRIVPHVVANISAASAACAKTYRATTSDYRALASLGSLLQRLGRWNDECSVRLFTVQTLTAVSGKEDPELLVASSRLGRVLRQQGNYKQAEELLQKTLKVQVKVLGAEHIETLASMKALSSVLRRQGKYEQAEEMRREVLRLCKKTLGDKNPSTLVAMNDLGSALQIQQSQHKLKQAEDLLRQALEIGAEIHGPEHPEYLTSMSNLASALSKQKKLEQAEDLHRQTLELRKKVLGPEHPNTLRSMQHLATVLSRRGENQQAEDLYRQTLEINKNVLGAEHPQTLKTLNELAYVAGKLGRNEQSEDLHRNVLQLRQEVLGAKHPYTVTSKEDLIGVLRKQGKHEEADQLDQELAAIEQRVH